MLCQVAMAPDGRLKMVDIADRLGIVKSAVTKTVDRLEARGGRPASATTATDAPCTQP